MGQTLVNFSKFDFFRKLFFKMPYHLGADNFDCEHYSHQLNSMKAYEKSRKSQTNEKSILFQ